MTPGAAVCWTAADDAGLVPSSRIRLDCGSGGGGPLLTPEQIRAREFDAALRGYDRGEVAAFLGVVASQQAGLRQRLAELERRLASRRRGGGRGPMNREEALEALGEEVSRILLAAEKTAAEIRARAEDEVERQRREVLEEVRAEVRDELEEARERAARLVDEAEREREEVLEELRGAMDVRDRIVTELRAVADRLRETTLRLEDAGGPRREVAAPGDAAQGAGTAEGPDDGLPAGDRAAVGQTDDRGAGSDEARSDEARSDEERDREDGNDADRGDADRGDEHEDDGHRDDGGRRQRHPVGASTGGGDHGGDHGPGDPGGGQGDGSSRTPSDTPSATSPGTPVGTSAETPPARPVVTIVDEAVSDLAGSETRTSSPRPGSTTEPAETGADGEGDEQGVEARHARGDGPQPSEAPETDRAPETDDTPAPTSRPVALRARTLAAVRPGMVRRLKRSLQDLQNETLTAVRESADRGAVERLLPSDDEVDAIDRVAERFLTAAFRGGAGDAAALCGAPLDADTVGTEDLAEVRAGLRDALDRELTGALRGTLQAGVEAGEPGAMLSERVGQVFRDVRLSVLDGLVEEALIGAYSRGLIGAWERVGQDRITWVLVDERRCPERRCSTNAAEGAVRTGGQFPSGHAVPPAHPACGCALEPAPAGSGTGS